MRKILLLIAFLLVMPFMLMGCQNQGIDLNDINIEAIDRIDIPEGTYTIQYTIEELSDLIKNNGAIVSFTVTDSNQENVIVTGNSFTVVANEVYTVVIRLTIGDSYKEKTITVTSVSVSNSVQISFELNGGIGSFPTLTVDKNTVLTLTEVPVKDGFTFGGWYIDDELTLAYTNQLVVDDMTLYAKWEEITTATATVNFDLQGGVGDFPDQIVNVGGYATRPSEEPIKEGFIFLGWYTESQDGQPFDFETLTIYNNTTVYAHWEDNQRTTYTVTYDLNGAFQSEPITEEVFENNSPLGPSMQFIYPNHLFIGWSLDSQAEVALNLETIIIVEDVTLYAVWHIDFDEISGLSYTENQEIIQSSTINNDGFVEQRISLRALFQLNNLESDLTLDEERIDFGILYCKSDDELDYYNQNAVRITKQFDDTNINSAILAINVLTEPLESDTEYSFVLFSRYETKIVYSPIYTYKTYIQVPEGSVVGANYVLSGGYYMIDTENTNFRPSMFIEVLEGFTATIDGVSYSSYSDLYREGIRQFVTKDIITGNEYLHVFNLDFQTPHVDLVYTSLIESDTSFIPQYRITFPFDDDINYPVSEIGILYSTSHPFLKLDIPNVLKKSGSLDDDDMYMITNSAISVSNDPVYIRAYVIINGKVSYSRYITKLEMDSNDDSYHVVETIDTSELKTSPEFGTSSNYTPSTMRVYKVLDSTIVYTDYPNSFELMAEGQYFVRNANGTGMIEDILIVDDFPAVMGVEDYGQYLGSVLISYDTYNPYWYYSLDGGEYVMLPAKIRLSVPGYYEIYYRTGYGMEVIHLEIVAETK